MLDVQGFGLTLPSLLAEAVTNYPDEPVLYQWQKKDWRSRRDPRSGGLTARKLQQSVTELALGLSDLGLQRGDRIGFLLHSNLDFCLADLGSLLAGLVNVPIDLTQTLENIIYVLNHSGAKALIVADLSLLDQVLPYLGSVTDLRWLIVAQGSNNWLDARLKRLTATESIKRTIPPVCLRISVFLPENATPTKPVKVPQCLELLSLEEIQQRGAQIADWSSFQKLEVKINPKDLATLIYIAGDSRQPQGVMLSHENIVTNVLTAFSNHSEIGKGSKEVALSFLPLTHIFARSFFYGHLWSGHRLYFSTPNRVVRHFQEVQPTIVITVPRLLEKVYQKIMQRGARLKGWR
ncbi:MAG: AMP-binding protein, partial [Moorea sp. SIO2B7]|nr:AMP-binding protein [Moorena sp. SIO2B7]